MRLRSISLFLVLALCSRSAAAQPGPGQNVHVNVAISSVTLRGDTTGVSSTVANLATSLEKLNAFLVDAPSGVLRIQRPSPVRNWGAFTDFSARPIAYWAILGLLPAGTTSPVLYYESVGLPAIVTFWAGGDFPLTGGEADEPNPSAPPIDPLVSEMINGKTVGVNPWPTDRSSKALIARLRTLTQTSCAAPLTWITSSTLCTKLIGYLDQAETNRAAGKRPQAKSAMNSYISSLSGKTAGTFAAGVTNPGYWLLKPNADIINSVL